ncbi:glutathione S-transferase [Bradyrhizobium sp. LA6.10]|uniref:glutathione S-transferase family protein n=1 Tax=Bradyrhizobium sp. LA6.10 TaxID=3156318 RepID=UPI00339B6C9A
MSETIVYGFPRSTFVNIVRLVLTHKDVAYRFEDLEPVMGRSEHLALHPFNRVPIFRHGDFTVYETRAIVGYIDEVFAGARLTPQNPHARARMNQWIGVVDSYVYPYMIYHVTHERLVFPELGIASDEKMVAHALPRSRTHSWPSSASSPMVGTTSSVQNSRSRISTFCQAPLRSA